MLTLRHQKATGLTRADMLFLNEIQATEKEKLLVCLRNSEQEISQTLTAVNRLLSQWQSEAFEKYTEHQEALTVLFDCLGHYTSSVVVAVTKRYQEIMQLEIDHDSAMGCIDAMVEGAARQIIYIINAIVARGEIAIKELDETAINVFNQNVQSRLKEYEFYINAKNAEGILQTMHATVMALAGAPIDSVTGWIYSHFSYCNEYGTEVDFTQVIERNREFYFRTMLAGLENNATVKVEHTLLSTRGERVARLIRDIHSVRNLLPDEQTTKEGIGILLGAILTNLLMEAKLIKKNLDGERSTELTMAERESVKEIVRNQDPFNTEDTPVQETTSEELVEEESDEPTEVLG